MMKKSMVIFVLILLVLSVVIADNGEELVTEESAEECGFWCER